MRMSFGFVLNTFFVEKCVSIFTSLFNITRTVLLYVELDSEPYNSKNK
jgi:hypothetical protein